MKMWIVKQKIVLVAAIFMLASIVGSASVSASLLITPWQVVIEGRDRTAQIVLVNTGSETMTYRLSWEQVEQTPDGGYYVPSDMNSEAVFLQNIAVFTPRQITLSPDEKQTVRIAIRRPAELADGEYKSHLHFEAIPLARPASTKNSDLADNEINVSARVAISYSIPLVYRVGDYDIDIKIGAPEFKMNEKRGSVVVEVPVKRSGIHGVIGQIDLYHTPHDGKETHVISLGNANFFPEITDKIFVIPTSVSEFSSGTLRVVFQKAEGNKRDYVVLAEETFVVGN